MDTIKLDDFPLNPQRDQIYEIIPDKAKIVASTNRLFNKYPTRYISAVPRFAINAYSQVGDIVLDPFCGSGTTAIEAMLLGRNAISIDIDPFARLLIKVKTTFYSDDDIKFLNNIVNLMKEMRMPEKISYDLPDIPSIDKWFCKKSQDGIAFLLSTIDDLACENEKIKDYLYVVVAGIIRKVSNADEVSPKPYISTRFPKVPAEPIELFFKTEGMYREAIIDFSQRVSEYNNSSIILNSKDARHIDTDRNVDLAVTSPPYINAYDYVRSLRFEDMWLGLATDSELRDSRKSYIGTESAKSFYDEYLYASQSEILKPIMEKIENVDNKRSRIVGAYFEDMAKNIEAVREKLKPGGKYVIVVGDSKIRGQSIPTAKILSEIAEKNGYVYDVSFKYVIRDRYLHLPRSGRGGIIKYDEVLVLTKA